MIQVMFKQSRHGFDEREPHRTASLDVYFKW